MAHAVRTGPAGRAPAEQLQPRLKDVFTVQG